MLGVLVVALVTGLATPLGAVPVLALPALSRRTYDTLLGLGAGLMLAAATLGLLTTALADLHDPAGQLDVGRLALVIGGFVAGVAMLFVMDRLIPHEHAGGHHVHVHADHVHAHVDHASCGPAASLGVGGDGGRSVAALPVARIEASSATEPDARAAAEPDARAARKQGLLVVGVMSLHRIPEGFAIGAAYAAGHGGGSLGLTLASAIAVQNAVEGSVMAAPLRRGGLGVASLLGLITATSAAVPIAALAGFFLSSRIPWALPPMLALAAGALIYLTCNEVIPESHSHGNEVRATFGILAGFLVIMVLQGVFGHAH